MPDLLEWLRRCARLFADRTGKSYARPIQPALGDELQKRSIQSHHVGLLRARMRDDVPFQRVEHVLGRDLAQPREVAAVVCFLQAQEVAPSRLEKALDAEARRTIGDELAP